jgi:hypothetical protein
MNIRLLSLLALSALPARAFSESDFSGWWAPSSLPAQNVAAPGPDITYLWLFSAPLVAGVVVAFLVAGRIANRSRS